jgi:hypothetical protein
MKKYIAALALLLGLADPALAQWQVPLDTIPVGRGPGITGFSNSGPGTIYVAAKGALCDGATDDTAAINLAEQTLSAAGGGELVFPEGTCIVTGLTKRSSTIWRGGGIGVTIIKLKAATTANAVVQGLNAYTLFGTSSFSGIENWAIRDLTIDGNKAAGGSSDCVGVYGWAWNISRIEAQNCTGWGLRTEYPIAVDGSLPDHGDNASSWFSANLIHDNDQGGVQWAGPQDSVLTNNYIYRNLMIGLWAKGPGGPALKVVNNHLWGSSVASRQAITNVFLDTQFNLLLSNTIEGATGQQIWVRASDNTILGGNIFYANASPNTVYGIRLGDTANTLPTSLNLIHTNITNTQSGALNFDMDQGGNNINVIGSHATASKTGWTGTPGANSTLIMRISGTTLINPTLMSFPVIVDAPGYNANSATAPPNGMYLPAANTLGFAVNSLSALRFQPVASAVNWLDVFQSATGTPVRLSPGGTDTNTTLSLSSKGTGSVSLFTNGGAQLQVDVPHTANAVNYFGMTGAVTTAFPVIFSQGSDTNIGINFIGKGNSPLSFLTNGGAQNQFQVLHTASATRNVTVTGSNGGNPVVASTAGGLNIAPSNGHVPITGGSAPTLTAGCNGAGSVVSGTDAAGTITGQTAAATTCTLQFGTAYSATPHCVASGQTSPLTGALTPSTTTLVVNFASTANYKFSYVCFGS